jgi:hypothetical protein
LLSGRIWYRHPHSLGIALLSVGVPHTLYLWYSVSVSLSCLRTPIHDSSLVSTSISFVSLPSLYTPHYHCYSYAPTNLFILTHTIIPHRIELFTAIHCAVSTVSYGVEFASWNLSPPTLYLPPSISAQYLFFPGNNNTSLHTQANFRLFSTSQP